MYDTLHETVAEYAQRQAEREARQVSERRAAHQRFLEKPIDSLKHKQPSGLTAQQMREYVEGVVKVVAKEMAADRARLDVLERSATVARGGRPSTESPAVETTVDAAVRRADEAIATLKALKPETVDEQRRRAVELVRARRAASCGR